MGGDIGVDSIPGEGSTFWFTVRVAPSAAPAPEEPDLSGLRVLLIEDNQTVQEVLGTYLAAKGMQVEIADTAEAGLALLWRLAASDMTVDAILIDLKLPGMDAFEFRRALDDESDLRALRTILLTAYDEAGQRRRALECFRAIPYGLIITDVHMPEMDGLELTAAIREVERAEHRHRVPIIALSADVRSGEAERYLAAGMDDCLRKPVGLAQLRDALARWLPGGATAPAAAPVEASPAASTAEILDLERMREIFGTIDGNAITGRVSGRATADMPAPSQGMAARGRSSIGIRDRARSRYQPRQ
jgi:CheY-like chemotaxis protein